MSKVLVNNETLANVAEAIRSKNGETDSYKPAQFAEKILTLPTGGGGAELPKTIDYTGNTSMPGYLTGWNQCGVLDWYIKLVPDVTVKFKCINDSAFAYAGNVNMDYSKMKVITEQITTKTFMGFKGKQLPNLYVSVAGNTCLNQMFSGATYIREIPEDFFYCKDENGNLIEPVQYWCHGGTSLTSIFNNVFKDCYSLRKHPDFKGVDFSTKTGTMRYSSTFNNCYALDEIVDFPVTTAERTANMFLTTFDNCYRAKRFTFATNDDGSAIVAPWSNQIVDLSVYFGYASAATNIVTYVNYSGVAMNAQITSVSNYKTYKNNPDSWTADKAYSRYGHDSIVETINSLPDCSSGTSNVLKLNQSAGNRTDGGAAAKLTEAEIAVATAKGWTITQV